MLCSLKTDEEVNLFRYAYTYLKAKPNTCQYLLNKIEAKKCYKLAKKKIGQKETNQIINFVSKIIKEEKEVDKSES